MRTLLRTTLRLFSNQRLEVQLQSELQNARVSHGRDGAKGGKPQRSADGTEVDMVEQIECLGAELQIHSLPEPGVLNQRHVITPQAGAVHRAASGSARSAASGDVDERRGVE